MNMMRFPTLRSAGLSGLAFSSLRSVVFTAAAAAAAVLAGCSSVKLDNEVPVETRTPAKVGVVALRVPVQPLARPARAQ